jgi:hypothetical protein
MVQRADVHNLRLALKNLEVLRMRLDRDYAIVET